MGTDEREGASDEWVEPSGICIRPFVAADQDAARRLVLTGLGEHFGSVDESLNPNLTGILTAYVEPGHLFVVAELGDELVGTGALVDVGPGVGRLVRMSVAARHRRRGIGHAVVAHLVADARRRGYRRRLIGTSDDWEDAIGFYRACGFTEVERSAGSVHLAFDLT